MVSVSEVFKTSLMLEGLQILRSYCTHSYNVLQQKNTDQSQQRKKAHGARSRRNQAQASRFSLQVGNIYTEWQKEKKKTHTHKKSIKDTKDIVKTCNIYVVGDPKRNRGKKWGRSNIWRNINQKISKTNLQKLLTQSNCSKDPKQHKYKIFPLWLVTVNCKTPEISTKF